MMRRISLGAVLALFLTAPIGAGALAADTAADKASTYKFLNLFAEVFEKARADYVEDVTDEQLIEAALGGMLSALDPHSSYMNPKNYGEMQVQTRGEFGGLGIEVTMEGGLVKVVSPIDDTPAFRAGLKPGDFITHLDGEAVLGLTLSDAVEKMRGKVGTDIVLTIGREGREPFEVTVTRAVIKIKSVRSHMEGKIGYVRITSFSDRTDDALRKAIKEFQKEAGADLQGIVLDLRNNPGGLLDQAIAVSDVFLDKGEIVSTRSRRPEDTQRYNARKGDMIDGKPMVVLVNSGSASASEIVAGALQDHGRAIVLGTRSFGKGSVQTIIPLSGHGAMRMTTARYYTPSGRSIQAVGIEPDIKVSQAKIEPEDQPKRRREADLRGALDKDKNGGAREKAEDKDKADASAKAKEDYQLQRGLDLLRGIAQFGAVQAKAAAR